jgi:hypothetical protein
MLGYDEATAVAVAQPVEPRVVVPVVAGSNPVRHPLHGVAPSAVRVYVQAEWT